MNSKYSTLYTDTEIGNYEYSLAKHINKHHKDNPLPSTGVCVLNGGVMFYTGVMKYLAFDIRMDFVKVSTYEGTEKMPASRYEFNQVGNKIADGQRLYVFDDIIDSGETAMILGTRYKQLYNPAEMILCSLIRRDSTPIDELKTLYSEVWSGFTTDEWCFGKGMDDENGFMRQLPMIMKLNK